MTYQEITLPSKIVNEPISGDSVNITIEAYIKEARALLTTAGNDSEKSIVAITEICNHLALYDDELKTERYLDDLAKEFKLKKTWLNIGMKEAKKKLADEKNGEIGSDTTATINRVEYFIRNRYDIFFNQIANKFMYKEIGDTEYHELNIDNIYRLLKKHHLSYSLSNLKSLLKSDFTPKVNVFKDFFENLKWDGVDYLGQLIEYLKVQEISPKSNEKERFKRMFRKMFVRMVACSLEAGFNKQVFVIAHDKQNSGKSTFWRWTCPPGLSEHYTESVGTSKDDLIALTENFVVNIDELSTLSKIDLNGLKSVISKDSLKIRLPYGERPEMLKRRCNFVASTNRLEFLNDETGSVRWVCFRLDNINWDYKKDIDINNVWAQAYHLFKYTDFDYQLNPAEIAENEVANQSFLIRTPEMELIQKYLEPSSREEFYKNEYGEPVKFMTATDVTIFIHNKNIGSIKLYPSTVGKTLKMLGFLLEDKYFSDKEIALNNLNLKEAMTIKGYYVKEKI